MEAGIPYPFKGVIWKHSSEGGWHFVSLPLELSDEIRSMNQWREEGWGRMKVKAAIKDFDWETAIWFDTKLGRYILPLKAMVRKKLMLAINEEVEVIVYL